MIPRKTVTNSPPNTRAPNGRQTLDPDVPVCYIRENFLPNDNVALVLIQKETHRVIQRVAPAEKVTQPEFQAWLRHLNASRHEVYLGMNAVKEGSRSRTKADIEYIRHVYLDFDEHGTAAVQDLLKRQDVPEPNYLVNTSPDRWQAVWRVDGFSPEEAERLMRHLVVETGADPAATDSSRVLRFPGFISHKHGRPFLVRAESRASQTYTPEHFPKLPVEEPGARSIAHHPAAKNHTPRTGKLSQSELDWAYAKRALARGESPEEIIAAIARYRASEKHNPIQYAERTVRKAQQVLQAEQNASNSREVDVSR
jgi:hypothetical protein